MQHNNTFLARTPRTRFFRLFSFSGTGPFTVFVPVDQAFEILISKLGGMEVATAAFDKDPELLTSVKEKIVKMAMLQIV